jgi:hypothetical protein
MSSPMEVRSIVVYMREEYALRTALIEDGAHQAQDQIAAGDACSGGLPLGDGSPSRVGIRVSWARCGLSGQQCLFGQSRQTLCRHNGESNCHNGGCRYGCVN